MHFLFRFDFFFQCRQKGSFRLSHKLSRHFKRTFRVKLLNLSLTLNNQTNSDRLHTSSGESGFYLSSQYGRKLKSHQPIKHSSGLLCIHQIQINGPRILDSFINGGFRNLVKNNTRRLCNIQSKLSSYMSSNRLSFAIFIGCDPDFISIFC